MARDSPVSRNFVPDGHGLVSDTRACLAETVYRGVTPVLAVCDGSLEILRAFVEA
jgi:hypothetical protein